MVGKTVADKSQLLLLDILLDGIQRSLFADLKEGTRKENSINTHFFLHLALSLPTPLVVSKKSDSLKVARVALSCSFTLYQN